MLTTEAQVYDQYQNLLDAINYEILNEPDDDVRNLLEPLSQKLTILLDDDDVAQLQANTAEFTALTAPMKAVNESLKAAQTDINAVADKLNDAGTVLSTLTSVLKTAAKFA